MNRPLLTILLSTLPTLALAESDSAYKALRVVGKQIGADVLNHVIEVRGRNGVPQPDVWKVTASTPGARGGLIETEVQRARIISRREPTAHPGAGQPMDFNQLNLDSDGAFTVANQEMQKRAVPFDRIDYLLRSPGPGTPPVWRLELFDRATKTATMEVSADTGAIIEEQTQHSTASDRDYVTASPAHVESQRPSGYSRPGEPFRGVGDFFHRLGKRMERRGVEIKRFFSGD